MAVRLLRIAAGLTHALTASGAAWGVLALVAAVQGREQVAFAWLVVALVVDSVDGPLARRFRVKEVLPEIDGALLDNVVDYMTYVVVPAVLLHGSGLLPAGWDVAAAAWICVVSAIQFAHAEAKTQDGYFRGFPSCWNVVALYLLALEPGAPWVLAILALLGGLSFAPLYCVYPNRTPVLRRSTLVATAAWVVSVVGIVAWLPDPPTWLLTLSLAYIAYYTALSLALTARRQG